MFNIVLGIILICLGLWNIFIGGFDILNLENYVLKSKVTECFKDTKWSRNTFNANGEQMRDPEGETQFYQAKSVDDSIKKLNKILK